MCGKNFAHIDTRNAKKQRSPATRRDSENTPKTLRGPAGELQTRLLRLRKNPDQLGFPLTRKTLISHKEMCGKTLRNRAHRRQQDTPKTLRRRPGTLPKNVWEPLGALLHTIRVRNRFRVDFLSKSQPKIDLCGKCRRFDFSAKSQSIFRIFWVVFSLRSVSARLLPKIDFCAHGQCFGSFFERCAASRKRKNEALSDRKTIAQSIKKASEI